GVLTYIDEQGSYHEEKVISEVGDYSRVYEGIYETLVNGAEKVIKDEETILQMKILEEGIKSIQESEGKI
ncbi:NAD(P)-dependent oxidoreductase, partial [Enterococcus faecium]